MQNEILAKTRWLNIFCLRHKQLYQLNNYNNYNYAYVSNLHENFKETAA